MLASLKKYSIVHCMYFSFKNLFFTSLSVNTKVLYPQV